MSKPNKIRKVWENRKQIAEGTMNRVFKKDYVEYIAEQRMNICNKCESFDETGEGCLYHGTQPCCDQRNGGCGCDLESATRAVTQKECPKGYWGKWTEAEIEALKEVLNQQ